MARCKYCGTKIKNDGSFCPCCGNLTDAGAAARGSRPETPAPARKHRAANIILSAVTALVLAAGLFGIWKLGSPYASAASAAAPVSGGSGIEAATLSAVHKSAPEAQQTEYRSGCFFVKDNQVFYIDNLVRTPILLVDQLFTGSYDNYSWMTEREVIEDIFDDGFYKCYSTFPFVLYSDRSYTSIFEDEGDITADSLCLKDISSPDGATIRLADNVDNYYTYFRTSEMAIYYVVRQFTDQIPFLSDDNYLKYRYDIQTGTTTLVEEGSLFDNEYSSSGVVREKWYGLPVPGTEGASDGNVSIREYPTGEMYYYRYTDASRLFADIYYWDGASEYLAFTLDSRLLSTVKSSSVRPLLSVVDDRAGTIIVKDRPFDVNPLLPSGGNIYNMSFTSDGNAAFCAVYPSPEGYGSQGLYKFSVTEDGLGSMELIDPDVARVDGGSVHSNYFYVLHDDVYYAHRDGSMWCNGHVVDPNPTVGKVINSLNGKLIYASDVMSSDGQFDWVSPYALKAMDSQSYQLINSAVIDYKLNINMWFLGDYDYWSKGVLYMIENGEAVPMVQDVNAIG